MAAISHSVEVNVPLETVYNQWARFEEFPRFMEGVKEVRRDGPNRLFWKAKIGGQEKQWEAEITEQIPNVRIAWRSVDGASNRGAVTFEELDVSQTRVTLRMDYEPEGFLEHAGDALGIPLGDIAENLNRFREFMENQESPTVAAGGQIEPVEARYSTEHAMEEMPTSSVEQPAAQKPLFQDREIPAAGTITEAVASGTSRDPIAGEGDEPRLPQRHGTVIADTPQAEAIKGSSGRLRKIVE